MLHGLFSTRLRSPLRWNRSEADLHRSYAEIGRPSAGVGSVIAAVLLAWRPATAPANSRSNSNYPLPINLETYRKLRNQIAKILVPLLQVWLYASRAEGVSRSATRNSARSSTSPVTNTCR